MKFQAKCTKWCFLHILVHNKCVLQNFLLFVVNFVIKSLLLLFWGYYAFVSIIFCTWEYMDDIHFYHNVRSISHTLKCWVSVFVMLSEGALWFGIFSCRLKVTSTKSSLDSQQQKWGEFVLHQCILMFRIFCK